jgi:hypothetical protein
VPLQEALRESPVKQAYRTLLKEKNYLTKNGAKIILAEYDSNNRILFSLCLDRNKIKLEYIASADDAWTCSEFIDWVPVLQ